MCLQILNFNLKLQKYTENKYVLKMSYNKNDLACFIYINLCIHVYACTGNNNK